MKRTCGSKMAMIMVALCLLLAPCGAMGEGAADIAGDYEYQSLAFLSLLSSSTWEYHQQEVKGTSVTIADDLFYVGDGGVLISDPTYEAISMDDVMMSSLKEATWSQEGDAPINPSMRYKVLDGRGRSSGFYIYTSGSSVWIAKYVDNTANGQDIITYIYTLSKK